MGDLASPLFAAPRRILMISPQPWNGLRVSKHYYADELANLGHQVWFVEPPVLAGVGGTIEVNQTERPLIKRVSYRLSFPYQIKFRAKWLFDLFMQSQARRIVSAIGEPPDIVWDFDNAYQFSDLRAFGGQLCVFHLVDDIARPRAPAKFADALLAVSEQFLNKISPAPIHKRVIPHGLSPAYEQCARAVANEPGRRAASPTDAPCVGYVGNLSAAGIDWPTILRMAEANPRTSFRFFGPFTTPLAEGRSVVDRLSQLSNVEFSGPKSINEIVAIAPQVDIWLVCYDPLRTPNGAVNSHKVLEYLATGNPVLANRMSGYAGSDLLVMPSATSNEEMPALLGMMLRTLPDLQAPERRRQRAQYALRFLYRENLRRIDEVLQAASRKASASSAPQSLAARANS